MGSLKLKNVKADSGKLAVEYIKFTGVGALSTLFHYATLVILVELVSVIPLHASMIGYAVGAVTNYIFNLRYTFKSEATHAKAIPKFLVMIVIGFLLNAVIMMSLSSIIYIAAQVTATLVVFILNFIISKYWVYSSHKH